MWWRKAEFSCGLVIVWYSIQVLHHLAFLLFYNVLDWSTVNENHLQNMDANCEGYVCREVDYFFVNLLQVVGVFYWKVLIGQMQYNYFS